MMKILLIATGAVSLAGLAHAGGFTTPVVEAAPVQPADTASVPDWSGAYAGGNLNYGAGKAVATGDFGKSLAADGLNRNLAKPDGGALGLRAGYDWQFGRVVAGLGGEYSLGQYKSGLAGVYKDEYPGAEVKFGNVATVYTRAGYAFADNWMAYGLLGYSRADGKASGYGGSDSKTLDGLTMGLGVGYAFDRNWSAYGEYTYTDFGTIAGPSGDVKAELKQFQVGLNYRF